MKADRRLLPKRTVIVEGELCALIPLTRGVFAIVDDGLFDALNRWQWYVQRCGYAARTTIDRKTFLMHRAIRDIPEGLQTDHINRNKLDNRTNNLRPATQSQNQANNPAKRSCHSGERGVQWLTNARRWYVRVSCEPIFVYQPASHKISAIIAARLIRRELHGEFAA